ncbi:hypothetical protein BV898_03194 [Hypsibius exemplaris]|uniref:Chitin-binding type-3 domain-containing protein n=1 Tax=Hypsibius exemplaris TaxID=2072580 RepID=A0A1W0X5A9_HYPEX|nr:hypothetical protein BV898_03194 [Hypsibius exemplaris]
MSAKTFVFVLVGCMLLSAVSARPQAGPHTGPEQSPESPLLPGTTLGPNPAGIAGVDDSGAPSVIVAGGSASAGSSSNTRDVHVDPIPVVTGVVGAIPWQVGAAYTVGQQVSYNGNVYNVIQTHTADAQNWTPDQVPALFSVQA